MRLAEPFTFFVDRSLGSGVVVSALRAAKERVALRASVAAFMLGRGDVSGPAMAKAFVAGLSRVKKALRRWETPMIGVVLLDGGVTMLYANGVRLKKPMRVK